MASAGRWPRFALFAAWLAVAGWLAADHAMWRDEVRAWAMATADPSVPEMLRRIHGEGHPAIWYLLLRLGHAVLPGNAALPLAAFAAGAAAAALLAWRAPFGWPVLALVLFGRFTLFEYTAMARNYGIGALLLYAVAALYPRWRSRGWPVGLLLAALANTSVPGMLLALAFLLFWAVDVWATGGWRGWRWGAGLTVAGAALCVATVYPPANDAAPSVAAHGAWALLAGLPDNGFHFGALIPDVPFDLRRHAQLVLAPMLLLATLPWWAGRPGALLAMAAAAGALFGLFALVYDGAYRHQALLLAFGVAIAWLVRQGHGGSWPGARRLPGPRWRRIGGGAAAALLALQVWQSIALVGATASGVPFGHARDVARLLASPGLRGASVAGDTDYMLETIGYYAPNPVYFVRERRFGRYVVLSKAAKRPVSAAEVLAAGRALHGATGRPVAMLMAQDSFRDDRPGVFERGSYGDAVVARGDRQRFLAAARLVASYPPAYGSDERYEVWVLPK